MTALKLYARKGRRIITCVPVYSLELGSYSDLKLHTRRGRVRKLQYNTHHADGVKVQYIAVLPDMKGVVCDHLVASTAGLESCTEVARDT